MKRIAGLALICLLILALTACSRGGTTTDTPDTEADFAPEQTAVPAWADAMLPEATQPEVLDIPLELTEPTVAPEPDGDASEPQPAPTDGVDTSTYRYQRLTDTSFGFTFEYPTHWVNLPGKYTVCFREEAEEGDFPARVAITKKTLAHSPSSERVLAQFQAYAQVIYAQYDPSTFELGELNASASFMGQKAYEITYLAYSGDVEVKGYMICAAVEKTIYVYHFCASYSDYIAMEPMMARMRDSVAVVQ